MMDENAANKIKVNSNLKITMENQIVRAMTYLGADESKGMNLVDFRVIRLLISQIAKNDTEIKSYRVQPTELAKYIHIDIHNIYRDIKEISKRIVAYQIYVPTGKTSKNGNPTYKYVHWVEKAEYHEDDTIEFKLSSELAPYITGLANHFTSYIAEEIYKIPSEQYSRFFELVWSYRDVAVGKTKIPYYLPSELFDGEIPLKLDDLREMFGCKNKYPNNSDFVKKVVELSVNSINAHTSTKLSYRVIRTGKKITHVYVKAHFPDKVVESITGVPVIKPTDKNQIEGQISLDDAQTMYIGKNSNRKYQETTPLTQTPNIDNLRKIYEIVTSNGSEETE